MILVMFIYLYVRSIINEYLNFLKNVEKFILNNILKNVLIFYCYFDKLVITLLFYYSSET